MGYQQPGMMGGQMMAPQPMGMNMQTSNSTTTNTTIVMQQADPYKQANGITEDQLDREFRIMAGTQESCPGVWCIDCKDEVNSQPEKETTCRQWCGCFILSYCGCCCVPFCMDDCYKKKHMCPKCGHHLALKIPGEGNDELGYRQDDLPPGFR